MGKEFEYVLNQDSMAVTPEYDANGKLCSRVWEIHDTYFIDRTPKQVINDTLHYFASNLEGAIDGSRSVIGKHNMIPIVISVSLNMYWLPTHSPYSDHCMWFALGHLGKPEALPNFHSKVIFKNGHFLKAQISQRTLEARINLTANLKVLEDERSTGKKNFIYFPDKTILYVAENEDRGFYQKD